jgi:Bacterial Ig-like domain (group 2)
MITFRPTSFSSPILNVVKPFRIHSLTSYKINRFIDVTGDPTEVVVDDVVLLQQPSDTSVSDWQILLLTFGGAYDMDKTVTYESSDTNIATVSNTGKVTYVADGEVTITVTVGGLVDTIIIALTSEEVVNSSEFVGYDDGSLAKHSSDQVDARIADKTKATAINIFSTQNHTTASYVRNTGLWCADWDLTCISPWNSTGINTRAGTLVSPRHIIFTAHYQINTNATIRFIMADGTVVTRTMVNKLVHPSYNPYYPDIVVGVLDSDVPEGITFAKVLPDDYREYLPSLSYNYSIPCLTLDQEEKALVTDLGFDTTITGFAVPIDAKRLEFYESKIGGDSGNPAFLRVNSDLVLLTVWTYGGAGSGTSITDQKTAINTMMTTLGGGYQLTECDLSSFNNYA